MKEGKGIHVLNRPGTYRPIVNKDNDYLIKDAASEALKARPGVAPTSVRARPMLLAAAGGGLVRRNHQFNTNDIHCGHSGISRNDK